jgi:tetratricopeptide (TPR) repeat protein
LLSINLTHLPQTHLSRLGTAYFDLGKPVEAIKHFEQLLAITRSIGDQRGEYCILFEIGNIYAIQNDSRKAIRYFEQALAITQILVEHTQRSHLLSNSDLSIDHTKLSDPEYLDQLRVIARKNACAVQDRRNQGNTLWCLAFAYDALGEREEAIARAARALTVLKDINDQFLIDKVRAQLAEWKGGS